MVNAQYVNVQEVGGEANQSEWIQHFGPKIVVKIKRQNQGYHFENDFSVSSSVNVSNHFATSSRKQDIGLLEGREDWCISWRKYLIFSLYEGATSFSAVHIL